VKPSYLSIHTHVIDRIKIYCMEQYPLEGYGFLAGRASVITHFFPIPCQNSSPCSLEFEPQAYLNAIKQIREQGLEWLGVVHSHPLSQAYPSARDQMGWNFQDKSFWIMSFKDNHVQLCAYYIQKQKVIPIIYRIIG